MKLSVMRHVKFHEDVIRFREVVALWLPESADNRLSPDFLVC